MNKNEQAEKPIAFFDSGVGGISVLATAVRFLPRERFIYFGDTAHAPYGSRSADEVRELSARAAGELFGRGCKALVVACNTATSAAIEFLRATLPIPVIGMEPALKPALERCCDGTVLVMATPLTLTEQKFQSLCSRCGAGEKVVVLPCTGIVELVEKGELESEAMERELRAIFSGVDKEALSTVVLGCTHYLFVRPLLERILPERVSFVDGNAGTIRQLQRVLARDALLRLSPGPEPVVEFFTSGGTEDLARFHFLYELAMQKQ